MITARPGTDMFFNECTSQLWCRHRRGEPPVVCKERVSEACNCSAKTILDFWGLLTCEQQTAARFYHCRGDLLGGFLAFQAPRLFICFLESKNGCKRQKSAVLRQRPNNPSLMIPSTPSLLWFSPCLPVITDTLTCFGGFSSLVCWKAAIDCGSMKTMMMKNEQAAASSVIPARTDGLCEHLILHLQVVIPENNRAGFESSKQNLFSFRQHPLNNH